MSESLVTRASRWARARLAPVGAILSYHRIADPADDPTGCAVSPAHFAQHLEVISSRAIPATLGEVVDGVTRRRRPARRVVVTIDDGYACGLTAALPTMERFGVPATFFVPAEPLRSGGGFHWDRLRALLVHDGELPASLRLRIGAEVAEWHVAPRSSRGGSGGSDGSGGSAEGGGVLVERLVDRERLCAELSARLHPLLADQRREVLEQVAAWAGREVDEASLPPTLDADGLRTLAASPLCGVGAHTVSHTMLTAHAPPVVAREMEEGRRVIEEALDRPVTSVAYPFGDFSAGVRAAAAAAGLRAGCTLVPEGVRGTEDPLALPRVLVRDCDGEALARTLHWLGIG